MTGAGPGEENEELWRGLLLGTDPRFQRARRLFYRIPSSPRCKMCGAPFKGVGRPLMHLMHRDRWAKNPKYCAFCFQVLETNHGGAEIEASFMFADIRGSTSLAEGMSATAFRHLLNQFYDLAAEILVRHDAIVDKFVGDEVVALFVPALTGAAHARSALDAARALIQATHERVQADLPIGIGVNTGTAFIGSVGEPPVTDLTALGDVVNTTARLASAAGAGEILVALETAAAAGLDTTGLERRSLELKGKSAAFDVVVLRAVMPVAA